MCSGEISLSKMLSLSREKPGFRPEGFDEKSGDKIAVIVLRVDHALTLYQNHQVIYHRHNDGDPSICDEVELDDTTKPISMVGLSRGTEGHFHVRVIAKPGGAGNPVTLFDSTDHVTEHGAIWGGIISFVK